MNDRELLELAAKAAGLEVQRSRLDDPLHEDFLMNGSSVRNKGQVSFPWNPLENDGDALRLAVKLKLEIFIGRGLKGDITTVYCPEYGEIDSIMERHKNCAQAATRLAIVRAAAEIGKAMP